MGTTLDDDDRRAAAAIADSYFAAWSAMDWDATTALTDAPTGDVRDAHSAWRQWLLVEQVTVERRDARIAGDVVEVDYETTVTVTGLGQWTYTGTVTLQESDGRWSVVWTPSTLHPLLEEGNVLTIERSWEQRGAILAADGTPIVAGGQVHVVGVVPEQINDVEALLLALDEIAGIPPEVVTTELNRSGVQPNWFLPVADLTGDEYRLFGEDLEGVDGVVIRSGESRLSYAEPFANQLLGSIGPITADLLDAFGPPYSAISIVGRSGLELALEGDLAGSPRQEIRRVNEFGRVLDVLHTVPGAPPVDVVTTLDVDAQLAAEAAVDGTNLPAALVAIDVSTGAVRAAAVRPPGGFDRAFSGLYPPGSTFKTVTASALLASGLEPDAAVPCPGTVLVGGREFRNAGDRDLGEVPLATAFAESCNTTFAALAGANLADGELAAWAAAYGMGTDPDVTVPNAVSSFPPPPDTAGRAAAAIGQAQVLVTPLQAASIAAAAVSGRWRPPYLTGSPAEAVPLPADVSGDLTDMLRLTVTDGTGRNAAVEGEVVRGKTGSAEYGDPDGATHAWFIGTWNDLAVAVVVEGGGSGGGVAAPIVADFLTRLIELRAAS
jgi:cell division protein FtsI/penicillin-binding protein 2